ncbi:MAG TPA: CerR family C-terminal domain-containing protein [Steroidobacteraceae bacterium]|nr:CerR family C-terminal domain-containing protein [Steroidobacteraceae bacterium]
MTGTARIREVVHGGYQCSAETRARILTGAMRLFAERGFDGASTRDIAAEAGVNAPALQYHFGNKQGVYDACVEHIVTRVWDLMADVVEEAEAALRGEPSDEELIQRFCALQMQVGEFMSNSFSSRELNDWRLFMARLQAGMGSEEGFKLIYEGVSQRSFLVTTGIVGRLLGRPADDTEIVIRTMALSGQMLVFQIMRRTMLTALGWNGLDEERLAMLKGIVCEQIATLLRTFVAERRRHDTQRQSALPRIVPAGRAVSRRGRKSAR